MARFSILDMKKAQEMWRSMNRLQQKPFLLSAMSMSCNIDIEWKTSKMLFLVS